MTHTFGYVPNEHLLKFLSSATQGMYISLDYDTRRNWPPAWWRNNRPSEDILNPIARGIFSWSFQKGINCSRYLPDTDIYWYVSDTIRKWHKSENLSYAKEIIQKKQIILFEQDFRRRKLSVPLERVVVCHLREGQSYDAVFLEGTKLQNLTY